jgi:phosphopantetheinyl transferase
MTRRTQEQWQALVEEQKHSGLTQTKFCEHHEISSKYFSLRKSQLKTTGNMVTTKPSAFVAAQIQPRLDCIEVAHQRTHLKLPASLSPEWLAQFVLALG